MPDLSHSHEREQAKNDEQSLTTILATIDQRAQFTSLLTLCCLSMRKTITDTFDPRYSGLPTDARFDKLDENAEIGEEEQQKQREEAEERIKELSKPEMQDLKKSALYFFDAWRDKVLARVADVLSLEEKGHAQKQEAEARLMSPTAPGANIQDTKISEKSLNFEDIKGEDDTMSRAIEAIYTPISTPLADLEEDKRKLVLHSLVLLLLSLETYSAHSRILLLYITSSLRLPAESLADDEDRTAQGLLKAAEAMDADKEKDQKRKEQSSSRKWKVGLAAAAGAAVIGVTGGFAAPLLAAGIATVASGLGLAETAVAGYLGALAGSSVLIGSLFGAHGAYMTGRMMDDYAKQVEDFAFLPIYPFKHKTYREGPSKLRVAVAVSGWLSDKDDVIKPWRVLSSSIDGYALRYEMEALLKLGNALSSFIESTAWGYAKKVLLRRTVFVALREALWPLSLLKVAKVIDNPFSVAKAKSDKAGEVLADVLINKVQGERPVTLVGYSLGARVIYTCLQRLAERKAFGLIENVILLGLPATSESKDWRKMRSVVSGRLINVYSENDYILALLYRTSSASFGVAGIRKAEFVRGVENVDATDIVSGHVRYRYLTGAILKRVGIEDIDIEEVEREEDNLSAVEKIEAQESKEGEDKYDSDGKPAENEAEGLEEEVEKKNKQSMMDWAKTNWQSGSEHAAAYWQSIVPERKEREKTPQQQWSEAIRSQLQKTTNS